MNFKNTFRSGFFNPRIHLFSEKYGIAQCFRNKKQERFSIPALDKKKISVYNIIKPI